MLSLRRALLLACVLVVLMVAVQAQKPRNSKLTNKPTILSPAEVSALDVPEKPTKSSRAAAAAAAAASASAASAAAAAAASAAAPSSPAAELPFDGSEDHGFDHVQDTVPTKAPVVMASGSSYIGRACSTGGRAGTCQRYPSNCDGGRQFTNAPVCPGDDSIRCCLNAPANPAAEFIGRACPGGSCQLAPGGCPGGSFNSAPLCPGPNNVQCCQRPPPPPSDPAQQYVGRACPGGSCQLTQNGCAGGAFDSRPLCPGPANVQCCVTNSAPASGCGKAAQMAAYALSHALPASSGWCARYVANAIQAVGINYQRVASAKDAGASLLRAGFVGVGAPFIIGDVRVIPNIPNNPHGHIQILTAGGWVSDFKQRDEWAGPAYRQYKPPTATYRLRC